MTNIFALTAVVAFAGIDAAFACTTDADCLLLGTCNHRACRCRQGFTGSECGQLDLSPGPNLGYRNLTGNTWGGLPLRIHGTWHMYVSMMAKGCPLGTFNNNSEVAHLVSSGDWRGPYAYSDTVVPAFAHNAAPHVLRDGSIGVWFIGYDGAVDLVQCSNGIPPTDDVWPDWSGKQIALVRSLSGDPKGPWTSPLWIFPKAPLPAGWSKWDCASTNPSAVVSGAGGSVRMMYRGTECTHCDGCGHPAGARENLGIATAGTVSGPYTAAATFIDLKNASVEDPFYWRGASGSHHLIAHSSTVCSGSAGGRNWCGVVASSADGVTWRLARSAAYGPNVTLANGTTVELFARQRPQLLFAPPAPAPPAGESAAKKTTAAPTERALLGLVNGAMLLADGAGGLMQRLHSFTLLQPVRPEPAWAVVNIRAAK